MQCVVNQHSFYECIDGVLLYVELKNYHLPILSIMHRRVYSRMINKKEPHREYGTHER